MRRLPQDLRNTHILGEGVLERVIATSTCPHLRATPFSVAGLTDAGVGYRMVRIDMKFEQIIVCVGGRGEVLVDDQWQPCHAGQAYIAPPRATHAYHTIGRRRWRFCWVIYDEPKPGRLPVIGGDRSRLVDVDPRGLWSSIEGLHREAMGPAEPVVLDQWVALVQSHATRIADPLHDRDVLWPLWAAVTADLSAEWSLERLAEQAMLSAEHVRRLCHRHTGRSPVDHVTHLRMARAAALLESTPMKIAAIARAVGYANPFAFSTAFRRIKGVSPAAWRAAART